MPGTKSFHVDGDQTFQLEERGIALADRAVSRAYTTSEDSWDSGSISWRLTGCVRGMRSPITSPPQKEGTINVSCLYGNRLYADTSEKMIIIPAGSNYYYKIIQQLYPPTRVGVNNLIARSQWVENGGTFEVTIAEELTWEVGFEFEPEWIKGLKLTAKMTTTKKIEFKYTQPYQGDGRKRQGIYEEYQAKRGYRAGKYFDPQCTQLVETQDGDEYLKEGNFTWLGYGN